MGVAGVGKVDCGIGSVSLVRLFVKVHNEKMEFC